MRSGFCTVFLLAVKSFLPDWSTIIFLRNCREAITFHHSTFSLWRIAQYDTTHTNRMMRREPRQEKCCTKVSARRKRHCVRFSQH